MRLFVAKKVYRLIRRYPLNPRHPRSIAVRLVAEKRLTVLFDILYNPPVNNWRVSMTRDDIMHRIREHDDFLILHGIKRIGLFGSYARGEQREDSDIDLLVEFDEGKKSFDNFMDLSFFLEDILGKRIDLLTLESVSQFMRPYIEKDVYYETIH